MSARATDPLDRIEEAYDRAFGMLCAHEPRWTEDEQGERAEFNADLEAMSQTGSLFDAVRERERLAQAVVEAAEDACRCPSEHRRLAQAVAAFRAHAEKETS